MNGAEALVRTLHAGGVDVCFANPGTSEMQFVDALDRTRLMRCVLGLFEGVVTGAADGYGRMTGKPAVSLLHLGAGLSNASANLHNAKRARTPMLNLVGEHASWHIRHDPPLASDIAGLAAPVSDVVMTSTSVEALAAEGAQALAEACSWPGRIATLIAPGDHGWDEGGKIADPIAPRGPAHVAEAALADAAQALDGTAPTLILIGGHALTSPRSRAAAQAIAAKTGARVMCPTSFRRIDRGGGTAGIDRLPYVVDLALEALAPFERAILIEAVEPPAFFGYPGKPSLFLPEGCQVTRLADFGEDGPGALLALADRIGADLSENFETPARPERPQPGTLTPETLAAAIGATAQEGAIYVDESITQGRGIYPALAGAPAHSWLPITGGAIGIGPPMAVGAAIACPERPVIGLQADGSAMYTIQALWTAAREQTNVTYVILANRSYEILKHELARTGANPGPSALALVDLDRPVLDFCQIARGMGVEATATDCPAELAKLLDWAPTQPGPYLIECRL
ncbi:MAG: acetolactate synthase large subunit [Pseudomonadota bacterium]